MPGVVSARRSKHIGKENAKRKGDKQKLDVVRALESSCAPLRKNFGRNIEGLSKRIRTEAFSEIMPTAHLSRTKLQTSGVVLAPGLVSRVYRKERPSGKIKPVRMNGLRVYINQAGADGLGRLEVFYSRREDGPYYRWRYEVGLGQWRFSRVHLSLLMRRTLCTAGWEAVPTALRARLCEHYLD